MAPEQILPKSACCGFLHTSVYWPLTVEKGVERPFIEMLYSVEELKETIYDFRCHQK
jgi:hypothetical protein